MCRVISVANIKGGVAKTTTAANLGIGLVKKGKRVLIIDLDPQGSLSLGLGIRNNKELPYTVSTVIQKVIMSKEHILEEYIDRIEERMVKGVR